ncbi:MAG: hypothetical protein MOB07_17995 [Acidobacteria bacterium]|nr:hypothetical protein [Acidobacteriota bacterium]
MSDKTKRILNGLESPFLYEELFAKEKLGEAPALSSSMIDESPFLQFSLGTIQEAEIDEEQTSEQAWDESELDAGNSFGEDLSDALVVDEEIDLEFTDHEFGLAGEWDADEKYDEIEEEIEEAGLETEEVVEEREDEEEDKYVQLLTKDDAARRGDPQRELEEREEPAPGFESQLGAEKTTFAPKATDRFILLVSGYNYRDHNDDYGDLTRNRARVIVSKGKFKNDDKLVFVWFSVKAGRVFVNRRTKGVWKLKNTADWTPIDEFKFNDAHSQSFSFEAIDRTKHYGTGKNFLQASANTVMSIVNVYEFITNLGRHRTGSVMELSIISHGFWNGPILVNSSDNAASGSASRDPSDKDGRGRKDFLDGNIDTSLVHDAFHVDGFSWIWGCIASPAPLAVIQGVADSRFKKTSWGRKVKGVDGAVYRADGKTPDTATFLFSLGKDQIEKFSRDWDPSFFPTGVESFKKTFAEIKEFAKKHSDDSYFRSLTLVSDKPCYGPPLGASTNYAAKDPYRAGVPVIHWVERGKKRPPPESGFEANYDATINFFVKSMSMPEDPEKRGYVRYSL